MSDREITAVVFSDSTIEINFHDPAEVKSVAGRPVVLAGTVIIDRGNKAFGDDVEDLAIKALELLDDILDEHGEADVYEMDDEDEDEPTGMGEG